MRVVVDTNVIVSGLLNPHGTPGEIIRMIVSGTIELCHDARILSEYFEVLNRPKFKMDKAGVHDIINFIENSGYSIASHPICYETKDKDDIIFLEVAICGRAECLITGNKTDYPCKNVKETKILSPREFLDKFK